MPSLPKISPEIYKAYQDEISKNSSSATARRKSISLNRFFNWAQSTGKIPENPIKPVSPREAPPTKSFRPKVGLKTWTTLGATGVLSVLIFLIANKLNLPIPYKINFAQESLIQTLHQPSPAGGTGQAPSAPGTIPANGAVIAGWNLYTKLTFADQNGIPQVGSQAISFKIYNSAAGGDSLYTSPTQTVTTDANGSTLISLTGVPTDLFFQNDQLFLEPQIGSASANVRIPVSTANTSTSLNGFSAANPDFGAGPQTIPVINSDGALVLASQAPAIKANEGNLLVEGQAVTIKSADGSNGNIEFNPDGSGYTHFLFEGSRGNFLNAQGPNLTTGSLYYGMVPNNATGYDLIKLQSGAPRMTTRFSVDALGNTYTGGDLVAAGDLATGDFYRLTKEGVLENINGYTQKSGNFTIVQNPEDYGVIYKGDTALSDVLNVTLNEDMIPGSHYAALTVNRFGGDDNAHALVVNGRTLLYGDTTVVGDSVFDGQVQLGNYLANPTAIGEGSIVYNATDGNVYYWNGSAWIQLATGTSSFSGSFADLTSGTNAIAAMIVDSGASLTFSGTGTINASDVTCTGCISNSKLANSSITINSSGILTGGGAVSLGGTLNLAATEADTLATVTGRGASTGTQVSLNGGVTSTGDLTLSPVGNVNFYSTSNKIDPSGNLAIAGTTTFGGLTYTWPGSIAANNYVLQTQTNGTLAWVDPTVSVSSSIYWTQANGSLFPKNNSVDVLIGANSTGSAKFAFTGVNAGLPTATIAGNIANLATYLTGNGTLQVTNMAHLTIGGGTTGGVDFSSPITSGIWNGSTIAANYGGTGFSSYTLGDILYADSTTSLARLNDAATGNVLISGGVGAAPSYGKVVLGTHTTGNYVSTITGTANQITASAATGDVTLSIPSDFRAPGTVNAVNGIYTGATAGTQRIDSTGNLTNIGTTQINGVTYTWPGTATTNYVLQSQNTGTSSTLAWVDPNVAVASTIYWTSANGALFPKNNTLDVLIGSDSTSSAKFAFTGVNTGGLPTASIAGNVANVATYLTGNGNLATTNMRDLTLGGSTTGNVVINSRGSAALTANGANLTTTGTFTLPNSNTLTGVANYLQNSQGYSVGGGTTYYFDGTGNINANAGTFAGVVTIPNSNTITGVTNFTELNNGLSVGGATTYYFDKNGIINAANITGTTINATTAINTGAGAGTTRIDASGNLAAIGTTQINGVTYTWPASATANYVLQSGNTGSSSTLSWVDPAAAVASSIFWTQDAVNGVLYPKNNSVDVLIGSSATTSAKFAFKNVLTGLPTASIAGDIANVATYLTGDGNLATTNARDLTLGGSTTGNVVINSRGSTALTANAANLTASGTFTLPNSNTLTGVTNYVQASGGYSVGGGTTYYFDGSGNINANAGTFAGNVAVNGGSLTTTQTTANLFNATATTLHIGEAATTVSIGAGTGITTINNPTLTLGGNGTINGGTGASGTLTLVSTTNGTKGNLQFFNSSNTLSPTGDLTIAGNASASGNLTLAGGARSIQTTAVNPLTIGGSTTGNITLSPSNDVAGGFVAPNTANNTDLGTSANYFRNIFGGVVNAVTSINTGASTGTARIDASGNLTNIGTTQLNGVTYTWPASATANYVLQANNTGSSSTLSWVDPAAAIASNIYWTSANGALFPKNNSLDVLIGSNATTSAKFAFKNVLTGTPTASISGSTANVATFIDGNGNISSTNRNNLTLGNSATYNTTGNILLNSNGTGSVIIGDTADFTDTFGPHALYVASPDNKNTLAFGNTAGTVRGAVFVNSGSNEPFQFGSITNSKFGFFTNNASPTLTLNTNGGTAIGTYANGSGTQAPANGLSVSGSVGIGTISPTAVLDVVGAASVSGSLTFRAGTGTIQTTTSSPLVIGGNTTGNITLSPSNDVAGGFVAPNVNAVTDLGTASLAFRNVYGTTLYTGGTARIDSSGNLTSIGTTQLNGVTYTWPATATANYVLQSGNTGSSSTLSWVDPAAAIASNIYWTQASGALFPKNNTVDVLIGANSTTSAKFAFKNVLTGVPTASISGNIANVATYLDGNGNLSTTNAQALTLGSSTTGNVVINSRGSTALTANGANLTTGGTVTLPNSNTLTGVANYLQNSLGYSVGGGTTYYFDGSGNLNANAGTFGSTVTLPNSNTLTGLANFIQLNNGLEVGGGTTYYFDKNGIINAANITGTTINATTAINTGTGAGTGRIDASGNLTNIGTTQVNGVTYTWPASATANYILQSGNTGSSSTLSWVDPNTVAASTIYWTQASGALFPKNNTVDVLIGANSTTSAKFAFTGVNGGLPTASIAGNVANVATYLTGNGNLATTNARDLTLGGSTTGNVVINSRGSTALTANGANLTTGGTVTLPNTNTLTGVANYLQNSQGYSVGGGTTYYFDGSGNLNANTVLTGATQRVDSTGNLTNIGTTQLNGVTYAWPASATANYILQSGNTGSSSTLSWVDPNTVAASTIYWTQASGALFPKNNSVDVLIGSSATTSAKFAFKNVLTGLPTASIAGDIANVATYLTGDGNLATTNARDLTLGGSTTGNVVINSRGSTALTANAANLTASGTFTLPNSNTLTGVTNYVQASGGYSVGGGTTYYFDGSGNINANAGTFAGNVAVNGGSLTTTQTTANLFNATATTLHIGEAATTVSIGAGTGITTINNPTLTLGGNGTINGGTGASGTLTLVSTTNGTKGNLQFFNSSNTLSPTGDLTLAGVINLPNSNTLTGVANFVQSTNGLSVGGGTTYYFDKNGIINAANITGTTINATTAINTGAGAGTGRIDSSGNLTSIGTTQINGVTYTWPASATANYILQSGNTGSSSTLSWVDPATVVGSSIYWAQASGALFPKNNTVDVLIGANSTTSAKFAFTGVNGGLPTASIAGNVANVATYLTGNGNLATTNARDLTLGGSTTGNVVINSRGSTALTANGANLTTGGTVTLPNTNTLTGVANYLQNSQGYSVGGGTTYYFDGSGNLNANAGTFAGNVAVNGGSLTTTQTTANLFNATATTLNIGGAATAIGLGASSVNLTLGSGATILTSSGNLLLQPAGTGTTANVQIGAGGGGSTTPDLLVLDVKSDSGDPSGTNGAMYYNANTNKMRCYQNGAWADCGSGSGSSNWTQDILGVLYPNSQTTDVLIGGTATTSSKFAFKGVDGGLPTASIAGNIANVASFLTGNGNLGTTNVAPITIGGATSGNITLSPSNDVAGGFVAPNVTNVTDLGLASKIWRNIYGTTIYQGINQVCDSSNNCGYAVGTNYWGQASGALYPLNNSVDLLLGATSTTSAKFAFKNVLTGLPTASIAGDIANVATYLTGDGNLATTNMRDLTLGGSTTGNVVINSRGSTALTANGANLTASGTVTLPNTNTLTGVANYLQNSQGYSVGGGTTYYFDSSGNINALAGTFGGNVAVNGGSLTTTQTTANLFNATATTLNIGGAATTALNIGNGNSAYTAINLGSGTGGNTINIAGTGATGADTINIGTGGTGADTINIGSNASTTAINVTSGTSPQTFTSSNATGNSLAGSFVYKDSALTSSGDMIYATASANTANWTGNYLTLAEAGEKNFTGNLIFGDTDNTGGGSFTGNFLKFNNASATQFTVDASGNTTTAGNINVNGGSILTASGNLTLQPAGSGTTANVQIGAGGGGSTTPDLLVLDIKSTSGDPSGTNGAMYYNANSNKMRCYQNGAWADCTSSGGSSNWTLDATNGVLYSNSNTADVLIGATSTASAKFAFKGVDGGLPTASISGNIANVATYLDGNGNLSTTNAHDLTLGSSTTGNVIINSRGSTALTANGANLTTGGNLALADTFTLQAGGKTGTAYNAFANVADSPVGAAAIAAITSDNDLFVGGDFQAGGTIYDSTGNVVAGYWALSGSNLYPTTLTNLIGIGTNSPLSRLSVVNNPPGGSLTGKAAFLVDQYENQDILTASASGITKMTLTNDGTLKLYNATSSITNSAGDITINAASTNVAFSGNNLINVGNITAAGNVAVNGGSLTTTSTTANLFNTGATTLNIGGAATTLNIGPGGSSGSIAFSGGSGATGCTLDGTTGNLICSGVAQFNGSTAAAYSRFGATNATYISGASDLAVSGDMELNGGNLYLNNGGTFNIADSGGASTIIFPAAPTTTSHSLTGGSWLVSNSVTQNYAKAALIVNQGSTAQDIFSASQSGNTKFVIANTGSITIRPGDSSGATMLTAGDGTGKIDVGTVDPPYTINGTKYATYLTSMVGVKEEVTGQAQTSEYIPGVGYRYVVDFNNLPEGSDLWLFGKATNIKDNIDKLVALLTPSYPTRVWYDVDHENKRLAIYSAMPTEISYRLTGPRFDYQNFPNQRNANSSTTGFIINSLDTINNAPIVTNVQQMAGFVAQKVQDGVYSLKDPSGTIIDGLESIGNFVAGNIKSGAIQTQELATNSLSAFQGTIDNLLVTSGLVTPEAKIKLISPLANETDVTVKLGSDATPSGKFAIQDNSGNEVASIDSSGNATFSGTVRSQNIDQIQALLNQVSADQSVLLAATSSSDLSASGSANLSQLITSDLYVTNHAAISSLLVDQGLTTGNINSLSGPLEIQSLAMAPVEIMAGLVTIDTHGNVNISGDLNVAGKITTPQLDAGIINATGSATLSSVTTPQLVVAASDATQAGTIINGVITTNSTVGQAVIPAGTSEITIKNPKITDYTLVYVTPTSTTNNYVLYVKSKQSGQFVVGFDQALNPPIDVNFNWWIVQVSQ